MQKVSHTLKFVTEVDETNPTGARLMALDEYSRIAMLESMLKEMIAPVIQPVLEDINAGGSWAILKLAE
jgi:hypothetical protein